MLTHPLSAASLIISSLAKPSRPARAYLQLTHQTHLEPLADKVKQTSFADARKTENDQVLLGPPLLEFAAYNRIPVGRKRNDQRAGLIDQDPEFIQFLESLTNPISKPVPESTDAKVERPKVTPLIQHLRDKKAAKEAARESKEKASPAKGGKHARRLSKNGTPEPPAAATGAAPKNQPAVVALDKKGIRPGKAERVSKPPKAGKKEAANPAHEVNSSPLAATRKQPQSPQPAQVIPNRGRGDVPTANSAAARMIQRDLGIRGGRNSIRGRGGRQAMMNGQASATNGNAVAGSQLPAAVTSPAAPASHSPINPELTTNDNSAQPPSLPAAPTSAIGNKEPPTGPKVMNKSGPGIIPSTRPSKPMPVINSNSTTAFLKHANPSQGITEPLLEEAFTPFGTIKKVEIDKRKGFAYIYFAENSSLQKAIQASPVKVATGNVQVLEFRERYGPTNAAPVGVGRGAPAMTAPRGAPANVGVGFRGGRSMRGRGGIGRGGPNGFAHNNVTPGVTTPTGRGSSQAANESPPVANEVQSSMPTPTVAVTQDTGG